MKVFFYALLFFFTISCPIVLSQEIEMNQHNFTSVYEQFVIFHLENEHLSPEHPLSHFSLQYFIDHPIKINDATKEEMEKLPLLSALDIEKIIQYRQRHGNIYTIYEIEIILSLDRITTDLLTFLIQFDHKITTNTKTKGYIMTQLSNQINSSPIRSSGFEQYKKQVRFSLNKGKFDAKVIGESDYGEPHPFYDHLSGYVQYQNAKTKIILGDYKPCFGQGVTFAATSFYSSNNPSEIINNFNRIKGYAQSDENNYLRGLAIEQKIGQFRVYGYYSNHHRDATIKTNDTLTYFNSINNDGIHISQTQKRKKDALKEENYGIALQYRTNNFKFIGYTQQTNYSVSLLKKNNITQTYFHPTKHLWNYGVSYHIYLSRFHLFGETAADPFNQIGHLHGIYGQLWPFYNITVGYRHYPQEFYMPNGNSYSTHSSSKNEKGPFLVQRFDASKKISLSNTISYYKEDQSIDSQKIITQGAYKISTTINYIKSSRTAFQFRHQAKDSNKATKKNERFYPYDYNYQNFRLQGTKQLSPSLLIKTEFQYTLVQNKHQNERGVLGMIYGKLNIASFSTTYLQTTFFHTDSYNSRIYSYENDLLYNFSIPSFYGKGYHLFILERIKLKQWCTLSTKIAYTRFIKTNQLSEISKASETIHSANFKFMLWIKL